MKFSVFSKTTVVKQSQREKLRELILVTLAGIVTD
jgi:hypothetical protein